MVVIHIDIFVVLDLNDVNDFIVLNDKLDMKDLFDLFVVIDNLIDIDMDMIDFGVLNDENDDKFELVVIEEFHSFEGYYKYQY